MKEYLPPLKIELAHSDRQYKKIYLEDLGVIGFADGYAHLPNDKQNIKKEIERRNIQSQNEKEHHIEMYEEGYDYGTFMSENAAEIHDEYGQLKEDEYDL